MSTVVLVDKLLKQRKSNAERASKFRANKIANDPEFLKKKAEYAKEQREKAKAMLVVPDIKKPVNARDKQVKKGNKIPIITDKLPKEYIKPKVKQIQAIEPKTQLIKNNIHYTKSGILLLNLSYFKDIDYSNVIVPQWKKTNNKTLSDKVIKDHLLKIKVIYEEYFKTVYDDKINDILIKILKGDNLEAEELTYLTYNDDFFASVDFKSHLEYFARKFIESPRSDEASLNTFLNYLKPIVNVVSRIDTEVFYKNYKTVSNILKHLNNIVDSYRKENIMKKDENDNKKAIDFGNKELINEAIDKSDLSVEDKALASLYLFIAPRRAEDYNIMIFKKMYNPEETFLSKYNYIYDEVDDYMLRFHKYKTSKTYGDQMYKVDDKYLLKYLKAHTDMLNDNDYLFKLKGVNKPIGQANFSKKIKTVFSKIFKINLTLDDIRDSAESWNINTPGRTMKEQEDFSLRMGHSLAQGLRYVKL